MLGEHTYDVLSKLGIADDTLDALAAGGVIHKVA
jgi:crotonobetainyl-CoA:carnitine CoA-transferase CaiB-like acyl-CoA transferase